MRLAATCAASWTRLADASVAAGFTRWRLQRLEKALASFRPAPEEHPDDPAGVMACEEALAAARDGNYGVGAVLLDGRGEVVLRAGNQVFEPRFASEAHAEMVLVSRLEAERPELAPAGLTLVVSLEPCPMCYARLKLAGIGRVRYLADDDGGGMTRRAGHMPLAWTTLHPAQEFGLARVSPRLRRLALAIFRCNLQEMRCRLVARGQAR
jgi:tRNA(adenine34) deaminase